MKEALGLGSAAQGSVGAILRNQHRSGAFVASPDFSQYQYCWLRDGSFTAYALDRVGRHEAARQFHRWCARAVNGVTPLIEAAVSRRRAGDAVDAARMPPARFSLEGDAIDDGWPNFQLDGYGTWLWALDQHLHRDGGTTTLPPEWELAATQAATYISELGTLPCFDVWEEGEGSVHTATLGCVYSGLCAAARMLCDTRLEDRAESLKVLLLAQAEREGYFVKSDHSRDVDAALLWLCQPFGIVDSKEAHFAETLGRVAAGLELEGGLRRYADDTYYGGGAWPVLTASLGICYASRGDLAEAERCMNWVAERVDSEGRLAEQYGGGRRDPEHYQLWVQRWGPPAVDLVWSHAMYVVLAAEMADRDGASPLEVVVEGPTSSAQI